MAADGVRFMAADRSHDAGIRALLRESSMAGDVSLSLRTEPSYFDAAEAEGGEHHAIVAVENGRVICVGAVAVRERYINGAPQRVGYLGRLRLAASHAGRFDVLRRGYACFRELQRTLSLACCFTSIAADNVRSRRLLERGLPGFPQYRPVGELVTLVLRASRFSAVTALTPLATRRRIRADKLQGVHASTDGDEAARLLNDRYASSFQFYPRWSGDDSKKPNTARDLPYRFLLSGDAPVGHAAIWDQRAFKQTVVTRYARRMRLLRPLHNLAVAAMGRGVPMPRAGTVLPQAFVSHLALPADRADWLIHLLFALIRPAAAAGVRLLAFGLDARDPRLPLVLRCFSPYVYHTRLYTVHWPGEPASFVPDGRLLYPEIALL